MEAGKAFPASEATSLLNPLRRLVQSPRRTIDAMRLAPTDRVLELGSGPGYFSPDIAGATLAGYLVLFDLQSRMLQIAGERLSAFPRCGYVQGDGTALPFADTSWVERCGAPNNDEDLAEETPFAGDDGTGPGPPGHVNDE